ncbi:hypothetical protein [Arthrobacter sp. S39]|uniref:hypothetical protein n=1 Tax=Arthrobacter sp. S39 TaxID=2509720 RepID=UPI001037A36F|nr:hypothetical protein [Arthrobacter sp. S39]TAP45631.1 hypothetical protein EYS21_02630 [Arthrobacter sp. S39]
MKKTAVAVMAGALVLGLTSCGTPVEKDATYGTVEELGRAVKTVVEVDCGQGTGNSAEHGWDQDTCGDRAVIGVFTNDATQREVKAKNPTDADSVIVEGPNWIVWAAGGRENDIKEKLGGTIVKAPTLFKGRIEFHVTSPLKPGIQKLKPGTAMECNVSPSSLMKDLSGDSKATITTASKLVLTGGIVSGKLDGETTCILSYEVPNIPGDDGPYEVMVGYRTADPVSQNELARGVGLQLGSK